MVILNEVRVEVVGHFVLCLLEGINWSAVVFPNVYYYKNDVTVKEHVCRY